MTLLPYTLRSPRLKTDMADEEDSDYSYQSIHDQFREDDEDSIYSFHSAQIQRISPWGLGNCFGSNVVWITFCFTILLLFVLTIYVSQVKMAPKNVPYIYLMVLMLISMAGQIYCLFYRERREFVRHVRPPSRATDFYIMAGLYLFGAGTLLSMALKISLYIHSSFLLYNCFLLDNHTSKVKVKIVFHVDGNASQNHTTQSSSITGGYCYTTVAYNAFGLLFVLLQVGFIHSFRHAVFLRSSWIKFFLSQTLLTNLCIWFKFVIDETGLFGDKEQAIRGTDQFFSTVEQFKDRLNPFILEFSLLAAGIFTSMASNMKYQLNFAIIDQVQQIPDGRNDNNNVQQRINHPGMQPGLLIGVIFGLFLVALGLTFGNTNNRFSEKSKAVYLVFESIITVVQFGALCRMIYTVVKHRREYHNERRLDYYLLSVAYFGTLVFDFVALYGVSISIHHKSKLAFDDNPKVINPDQPRDDVMILVLTLLLAVFHPLQMVAITGYFRRFGPVQEMRSAGELRQLALFLIVVNIGSWAVDSFIEIRNHAQIPYYSASHYFKGWETVLALSFPFCVFFRFHSALLLFEFWQRFKFG